MGVADGVDTCYFGTLRRITTSAPFPSLSYRSSSLLLSFLSASFFLSSNERNLRVPQWRTRGKRDDHRGDRVSAPSPSPSPPLSGGQCCIGRGPFKGLTSVMQINHRDTSKVAHYARDNSLFFNCSSSPSNGYDREKLRCVPTTSELLLFSSSKRLGRTKRV